MPDPAQMTDKQRDVFKFIREKIDTRGYGPTVREIAEQFKIKSPNGVMCHLKALEKKGFIQRQGFAARAIQVVGHRPGSVGMPLLGLVAAGSPTAAEEMSNEYLQFSDMFTGDEHFALQVRGRSMIDDHIEDGDFVIIRKQENARNGERVVAMVEGDVTLKKFFKERNRIRLDPANGDFKPIYAEPDKDVRILGLLVGVVRKYG